MDDNNVDASARAAITERNARESPLLRLPPELRNHIWHNVIDTNVCNFITVKSIGLHHHHNNYNSSNIYPLRDDSATALTNPEPHRRALLRVCRQIYFETSKVPVTFTLTFDTLITFDNRIDTFSKRMRSAVDELCMVIRLDNSAECTHIAIKALMEEVEPIAYFLPCLKRVNINYIISPNGNPGHIKGVQQRVEEWLRRGNQDELEMVAKTTVRSNDRRD